MGLHRRAVVRHVSCRPLTLDPVPGGWGELLQHLAEPILVIDRERNLRFVNAPARRLLGYDAGEPLEGRCRHLVRGLDCEAGCPVTFALQHDLEVVEGFATEYRCRDGRSLPVRVTVVRLVDANGELVGHVEILRPEAADLGFYLVGRSRRAVELRTRIEEVARSGRHLFLIGEPVACADVARALHRVSGLPAEHFHHSRAGWQGIPVWPPGTLFLDCDDSSAIAEAPPGWRVVVAARQGATEVGDGVEVVVLPPVAERRDDLPQMLRAWVERLAPGVEVSGEALDLLCGVAAERGFEGLCGALEVAVAAGSGRLEAHDLPLRRASTDLIYELLEQPDPLSALEQRLLREVLERCGWRMQEAADRLGISRVTLWRKLREHGIEKEPAQSSGVLVNR